MIVSYSKTSLEDTHEYQVWMAWALPGLTLLTFSSKSYLNKWAPCTEFPYFKATNFVIPWQHHLCTND